MLMRIGMRLGPFWVSTSTRRRGYRRPPLRPRRPGPLGGGGGGGRRKVSLIVIAALALLLIIIGCATGAGKGTPTGNTSPTTTTLTPTASAVSSAPAIVGKTRPTVKKTQPATTQPAVVTSQAAATSRAPAPSAPAVTTPAAAPSPPAPPASTAPSCHPLTNGGNCYEPGEYCRNSDHGVSGVAGDGKAITCEDNDGWRWEPS